MNNKLAKKLRKFVKETMHQDAQWCAYDTKIVTRPTILDITGKVGESKTLVKTLVKGCGKQRYKYFKKLYKKANKRSKVSTVSAGSSM